MTKYTEVEMVEMAPKEFRAVVRSGQWTGSTHGLGRGYAMTDIVVLPKEHAYDFLVFSHRNPGTCPVVDITEVGSPHPPLLAPDADLRTDLPRYRVYSDGQVIDEPSDIKKYWRDDFVTFLLGEAGSFQWSWKAANIPFQSKGVFTTNIPLVPSGPFCGNMAVSCKVFKNAHYAVRAIQIASRHPLFHGPPIHIGDPTAIGIKDISQPDLISYGKSHSGQNGGEIVVSWPCFETVRNVVAKAKLPFVIVDYPLHNFISDKLAEELAII
jgi:uncharacterized protein YcsI (UPF0317 family)